MWNEADKLNWLKKQDIKRSYNDEVVDKIFSLKNLVDIEQYGTLSFQTPKYPLYILKSKNFNKNKKTILVTGGVHGYETSGVHGALSFVENKLSNYTKFFNFIVAPCVSPWAYETINRWNYSAIDPNRSFYENGPTEECNFLMTYMKESKLDILAHFDLHETTDTDNTIFRPALQERDGKPQSIWEIPDGFYAVGDSENPCPEFQKAIIESVKKITHIAPADTEGRIIGDPVTQEGVINYPVGSLFLCTGFSRAKYSTTTEVYPDSPRVTSEICMEAQVFAIVGGLDYLINVEIS